MPAAWDRYTYRWMGRRSRRQEARPRGVPTPVAELAGEWKALSAGELAFLALVAVGVVVFGLTTADGVVNGLVAAVSLGLVAGLAIALNRRRRGRTPHQG
jgi:hypothetical protein